MTRSRINSHLYPRFTAIIPATAAARISAIWFAPERVSSRKNFTLRVRKTISTAIGRSDCSIVGVLYCFRDMNAF